MSRFVRSLFCLNKPFSNQVSRAYYLHHKQAIGCVYMLHRVDAIERECLPVNEGLKIGPTTLIQLIEKYCSCGVDFLSLDQVSDRLSSGLKPKNPFIAFTLDDGYLDNYEVAYPIFKKYKVPFAVYLTTSFPDRTAVLWWYSLEELIRRHDFIEIQNEKPIPCRSAAEKEAAFLTIRSKILSLPRNDFADNLKQLFCLYDIDWLAPVNRLAMTWEQVKILSNDPLCTIGGHTINHPPLSKISEDDAAHEIAEGNRRIEEKINKRVLHFAYPFGTQNEAGFREYSCIKKLGMKSGVISNGGVILREFKEASRIPRLYLSENS